MRAQPALLHDLALKALPDWWERIDDDPNWQKYSFTALAVGYGLLALVALVQLIRIQRRVPQFGWTTQKVFHLLNAFVCILRCVVLAMRDQVRPPLRARAAAVRDPARGGRAARPAPGRALSSRPVLFFASHGA
jgi:hypothetical protein